MAKGYIIVDIPERCSNCVASDTYVTLCRCTRKKITKPFSKPDWCPIKEMPERIEPDEGDFEQETYADGRNDLIDEMFGGEDEQKTVKESPKI